LDHLLRIRSDQLAFYGDIHKRYGDAVSLRLGPYRTWLLFHPDQIEAVLATQARSFVRFEPIMRVLAQWNGESLLVSEGERWRNRRRQVLPAFASRRLPGYGERVVARSSETCKRWEALAKSGVAIVDTDREMVALTLDIAADTLFGEELKHRTDEVGEAVAILSDTAFRETTTPLRTPDWLPFRGKARKDRAIATMKSIVDEIVQSRMATPQMDRGDLLSMLINASESDAVATAIRDEVMTLLIAGHETTGAVLSWASYLLGSHPEILAGVHQEIDAVLGPRAPQFEDLVRLPQLRAVLNEALRLYPPAYALFPRRATEDVQIGPLTIRKGELAQIIPFVTHRDGRWFEDAADFRPDRFAAEPTWPAYAYVPFGSGPRVCIGQAFGLMETALALATLLQRFSPEAAQGPVVPEPRFSLRPRGGLPQVWRRRSTAA
jgi:cytochrome P450